MRNTVEFQITVLYRDFLACTTEALKKLGLNFGQMPLILYVGKHPDCNQADLTRNLKLDWGYSQRSIVKLVDGGFMNREPDKSGNRLHLTEKGETAFAVCHEVFGSWDSIHTDKLTAQEKETLFLLLSKLTEKKAD